MAVKGNVALRVKIDGENKANAAIEGAEKKLKGLAKTTDKSGKSASKNTAATKGLSSALGKLAVAAAATAVVYKGLEKAFDLAKATAEFGDTVAKTSQRLGLSVESFQELDFALKISGSSMEAQTGAFVKFARIASDANLGLGAAVSAFGRLGVEVKNSAGEMKSLPDLVFESADAFSAMEDGVSKTALAQELFGRKGTDMLQFLNLGSEGIRELGAEAQSLGGVMGGDLTRQSENFMDALTRLETAFDGVTRAIGTDLFPILEPLMNSLARLLSGTKATSVGLEDFADVSVREMDRMADSIEAGAKRAIVAMAATAEGAGRASTVAALAAVFQNQVARLQDEANREIASLRAQAAEAGQPLAAVEHLEAAAGKRAARLGRDIVSLREKSEKAIKDEVADIERRVSLLGQERQLAAGRSQDEIDLANMKKAIATETGKLRKSTNEGQRAGHLAELEALQSEAADLEAIVRAEKKRARSSVTRAAVVAAMGVTLADGLALLRSQLAADGELDRLDRARLAVKTRVVELAKIEIDLLAGKITAEKAANATAIATNKERAELAKIEGEIAAERAKSAGDAAEDPLAKETERVQARIDLMQRSAEALSEAANVAAQSSDKTVANLGRMTAAMSQNAATMAKGGAGAISASGRVAAAVTEDIKKQALIQGAFETAAGVASLAPPTDPLGAALHFASAGLFFALAATGAKEAATGAGGGAGAAAGGGGGGFGAEAVSPEGGGVIGSTIIFNSPIIASDAQEAAEQISDIMGGNTATGMQGGAV